MDRSAFDYSPKTIHKSVERSLKRLNTDYLDVVYLHDAEFVAEEVTPKRSGNHESALDADARLYGLAEGQEAKVWGKGDQVILDAYNELRKMQSEGLIRRIGITGTSLIHPPFPAPTPVARLPFTNPSSARAADIAHTALQTSRYYTLLFAL